jgi:hypothetical protein
MLPLRPEKVSVSARNRLLEVVARVPEERWEEVSNNARSHPLFINDTGGWARISVLRAALNTPVGQWEKVCNNARSLFTKDMGEVDKYELLKAVALVPVERWEEVYKNAHSFSAGDLNVQRSVSLPSLLEEMAQVPVGQSVSFYKNVQSLFNEKMSLKNKAILLRAADKVPDEQLGEVCNYARSLFNDDMTIAERSRIIQLLGSTASFTPQRWKVVYDNVLPLLNGMAIHRPTDYGIERIDQKECMVIEVMAGLPVGQLIEVCKKAHTRFSEHIDGRDLADLLREIASQAEDGHN